MAFGEKRLAGSGHLERNVGLRNERHPRLRPEDRSSCPTPP